VREQGGKLSLDRCWSVAMFSPHRFQHGDDARVIEETCRKKHRLQGPKQIEAIHPSAVLCAQSQDNTPQPWIGHCRRGHQASVAEPVRMTKQGMLRPHASHRESSDIDHRQLQRAEQRGESVALCREGVGLGIRWRIASASAERIHHAQPTLEQPSKQPTEPRQLATIC